MRRRFADVLACAALLALTLVCFSRLVARPGSLLVDGERPSVDGSMVETSRAVGNDLIFLFLPRYQHITAELARSERLPLWDTSGFAGRPLVGNPQGGVFYPPVWAAWACRAPSALGWLTVGHLLWGGIGVYVLMRSMGLGRLSATVAAGCFEASPYLLAHTFEGHYPHIWAVAWYPWAFWAFHELRRGRLRAGLWLVPILALCFLTGHPQEWYYLVLALGVWAVIETTLRFAQGERRGSLVRLVLWAGVAALSLGLVAVELLPELAAQADVLRSGRLSVAQASRCSPHWLNLLQLLSPFALGGPADYLGRENYWESVLGIGLAPLILAAIAVTRHSRRCEVAGWLALTVVAAVVACGRRMMLFSVLYSLVPGMDRFRVPARALFLANLGAAVLAGFGIEALRNSRLAPETWRGWLRSYWVCVGLLLVGLCGLSWCGGRSAHEVSGADEDLLRTASVAAGRIAGDARFWAVLGAASLALVGTCRAGDRRAVAWVLGGLALAELGLCGRELIRVAPAGLFLDRDPVSAALAHARPPGAEPVRIRARDAFYNDLRAATHGFEKINVNDWFQIQRSADLYQSLYRLLDPDSHLEPGDTMNEALQDCARAVRQGVLDRLGVAFLVSDHVEPEAPWPVEASGAWQGRTFVVYRNPTALPRAYVVPRAYPVRDDDRPEPAYPRGYLVPRIYPVRPTVHRILTLCRLIDPREAVLLNADPLPPGAPRQPFTPAEWVPSGPNRVVVRVRTEAPGLLVVADTWMPGWTARVDGQPAPVLRGNHAQRVVPLAEAGPREIVLSYLPPGLLRGAMVSGLSALVWAVLLVRAQARRSADRARSSGPHAASRPGFLEKTPLFSRRNRGGTESTSDHPDHETLGKTPG